MRLASCTVLCLRSAPKLCQSIRTALYVSQTQHCISQQPDMQAACTKQLSCRMQAPTSLPHSGTSLPPHLKAGLLSAKRPAEPRKVAVAFDGVACGRHMLAWASRSCLLPDDELYIVNASPRVSKDLAKQ